MTVYELIQELAQYEADQEVEINVVADEYSATVQVQEDVSDGEETDVDIDIDEDITEFSVYEYKNQKKEKIVRIIADLD